MAPTETNAGGRPDRSVARAGSCVRDVGPVQGAEVAAPAERVRVPAPDVEVVELAGLSQLAVVQHRAVQGLEGGQELAAVAGQQGERGGETAARAGAINADASGIDAELAGVSIDPLQAPVAILERSGICRVGRKAVLDRHADDTEPGAPVVEQRVVERVRTHHVTAPVDAVDARQRTARGLRAVNTYRNRRFARQDVIRALDSIRQRRPWHRVPDRACLVEVVGTDVMGADVKQPYALEDSGDLGIDQRRDVHRSGPGEEPQSRLSTCYFAAT